ncbi:DNA replication licensing factor MCM3 isoform X1 [Corythoichthys intestinalis]|uniref:DNA replication licensing factor MCM3 isoform X1 n=2 Tax=Corythoichthys intestinalis TaxID=161448 RepID=UPI0025A50540|nr:DNA replication licensing factor MCM3 isoform X1 [Corythoichthys intestinalis]
MICWKKKDWIPDKVGEALFVHGNYYMMATDVVDDRMMREAQRDYLDFLDDDQDQGIYQSKVRDMISENKSRLIVNINDLRRRNDARAAKLMNNAFEELTAFQLALKDLVASVDATYAKQYEEFNIGLEGSFGSKHVTPRTLTSRLLGSMVCVEGIITKCSLVRPKVVRSVHYCPATNKTMERKYTDMTSLDPFPSSAIYPTKDEENNPLETEFGLSIYKDHQTITVQEMPEKAPAGQLPRSVDIILDNDLVDVVKPGDRVQVIGTYRCLPGKKGGFTSGTFRTIMIACHIKQLSKEVTPSFNADDVSKIRNFSQSRSINVFDQLARSLAPSIHGHEYIKKAILCMLLGGVEKVLENGSRIRGDINILLIGDPSVAKSQLLRYVLHTAPRAIPTTGRGSSGVGLTAAVTTDQETGERRLEAGAMVLADRGVVCIDEFDKMSDMDRTAIHEVMEQGRVTIAKAGIHARLNARCSVLAAANPVYGRYNQYKTPMENIGLQDSLLSRFDLLFIVLDQMNPEQDREISDHVLRMHRYRDPREQEGAAMALGGSVDVLATDDPDVVAQEHEELQVYEKHNNLLHGSKKKRDKILSKEFMRKYIHIAKGVTPVLTEEAASHIAEEYSRLRSQEQLGADIARTSPVTARTLETLIRLSTAHAKARMSKLVEMEDSEVAVELVQFAYFKKVLEKEKKRSRKEHDSGSDEEEEEASTQQSQRTQRKRVRRGSQGGEPYSPYDFSEEQDVPQIQTTTAKRSKAKPVEEEQMDTSLAESAEVTAERLKEFKSSLFKVFQSAHAQSVKMEVLMDGINKESLVRFTEAEVRTALTRMQNDNQVMVADDIIFLI